MMRLSIIIPFYNVEQYIAQCLDSVYHQDIPEAEYEVICVNDASPDKSRDIVLEYQKLHSNLILIEHEVNKKLGAARNTGRRVAQGKYIWNVDSDDMIAPNCLGEMLALCEKEDLDVLMFAHKNIVNGSIVEQDDRYLIPSMSTLSGIEFMKQYGAGHLGAISPVWRQLFRREFLNEQCIYSLEVNMSEDVPYTYRAIVYAKRLQVVEASYYLYRNNLQSIGGQMNQSPSAIGTYESCFTVARELFNLANEIQKSNPGVKDAIRKVGIWCFLQYETHIAQMSSEQQHEFLHLCRQNAWANRWLFHYMGRHVAWRYVLFLVGK